MEEPPAKRMCYSEPMFNVTVMCEASLLERLRISSCCRQIMSLSQIMDLAADIYIAAAAEGIQIGFRNSVSFDGSTVIIYIS